MNNLETIEKQHQLCKQVAEESISKMLIEYIDPKYDNIQKTDYFDLNVVSYFDYLILPLLANDEVFMLNSFMNQYFIDKDNLNNFKQLINKSMVFEDIVELVILVKRIHDEIIDDPSLFEIKMLICVFYFRQMKELKNLHSELHKLNLSEFDTKTYVPAQGLFKTNVSKKEVIEQYKLRSESKLNLLNCINIFQKKNTELVK